MRSRTAAVRVLSRVLLQREDLQDALDAECAAARAGEGLDRGWLHEVCAGTLRWRGRIDLLIDAQAQREPPSGELRRLLTVGAYQLLAQPQVPAALVVSETVDEIKARLGVPRARFANAVLRRVAEEAPRWGEAAIRCPLADARPQLLPAWWSLPGWIWDHLVSARGVEWAARFGQACLERPVSWARARTPDGVLESTQSVDEDLLGSLPVHCPGLLKLTDGARPKDLSWLRDGRGIIQDISNQVMVAWVLERLRADGLVAEGARALDLCAAPGGKSVGLAWAGFHVTATDKRREREVLLRETLARTCGQEGARYRVLGFDDVARSDDVFDFVWVDAPCTGTGVMRRHPEIRWLRRADELSELVNIQQGLFKLALRKTKPGGVVAYSVCSVLDEEGEGVIRQILPDSGEILAKWESAPQDAWRGDGFFAVLVRKSDE